MHNEADYDYRIRAEKYVVANIRDLVYAEGLHDIRAFVYSYGTNLTLKIQNQQGIRQLPAYGELNRLHVPDDNVTLGVLFDNSSRMVYWVTQPSGEVSRALLGAEKLQVKQFSYSAIKNITVVVDGKPVKETKDYAPVHQLFYDYDGRPLKTPYKKGIKKLEIKIDAGETYSVPFFQAKGSYYLKNEYLRWTVGRTDEFCDAINEVKQMGRSSIQLLSEVQTEMIPQARQGAPA